MLPTVCAITEAEETFARHVASGENGSSAYRLAWPDRTDKAATIWNHSQVVRARVGWRITELQKLIAEAREKRGHVSIASKLELEQFATRALRAPLALLERESDLIHKITTTTREDERGITTKETIEAVGKVDALRELAKLAGHYAAEKIDVGSEQLTGIFAAVRGSPRVLDETGEVVDVVRDYSHLLD